jgi:hypothetical protein
MSAAWRCWVLAAALLAGLAANPGIADAAMKDTSGGGTTSTNPCYLSCYFAWEFCRLGGGISLCWIYYSSCLDRCDGQVVMGASRSPSLENLFREPGRKREPTFGGMAPSPLLWGCSI